MQLTFATKLSPMPKVRFPLTDRIKWAVTLYLCKAIEAIYSPAMRYLNRSINYPNLVMVRRYPCRPTLENRIFYPPDYRSGDGLLPLYLNMHGGGFAFGEPSQDDEFCSDWARRTGMLVVSVNYRKAPLHPFPTASHDVAAISNAVINDDRLPIDKSRIVIGGFSAGGSLALSASQLPALRNVIKAAVVYYPVVDFSVPPDEKLTRRPYKGGPPDRFGSPAWWLDWGYVCVEQNRRDQLLSPYFANKEDLPPRIYIIGAQWDMFRLEAQEMIHRLAGLEDKMNQEEPFESGTYKWTLALGCSHGFTHYNGRDPVKRLKRKQKSEPIFQQAHQWLESSVLKPGAEKTFPSSDLGRCS